MHNLGRISRWKYRNWWNRGYRWRLMRITTWSTIIQYNYSMSHLASKSSNRYRYDISNIKLTKQDKEKWEG
jgi:hypothetical protein